MRARDAYHGPHGGEAQPTTTAHNTRLGQACHPARARQQATALPMRRHGPASQRPATGEACAQRQLCTGAPEVLDNFCEC